MAMDKDILGTALHTVRSEFENRTYEDLIDEFGTMDAARLAYAKKEADEIIKHIKQYAQLATTGKGLTAGASAVTGTSTTDIIQ